jgi:hypothetical protein
MSSHATAESLSLYLDAALSSAERRQLEAHVETCPACRQRLDGLRRVVTALGELPTAAPPGDMAARVGREIDLRGRRRSWGRLREGRPPWPLAGLPPLHIPAVVLALAAIVYLFVLGVEMRRDRPTRIVLPGAASTIIEPSAEEVPPTTVLNGGQRLYLLGGRFHRADGVWVEEGLGERLPDARVALQPPVTAAVSDPAVAQIAALGAPLRLRVGDEVVEIAFTTGEPLGD